ncbi:pyrroloquinoline quinone biosynthesis protein PqqB [Streptomyces sp. 4N509B]|uniref:pyrroloquinoline quinone biosynthesis protein PqqB n=1 Tax=Streptomyces sp. 4N509B TaxID=3457413 RepID=UPI003FD33C54
MRVRLLGTAAGGGFPQWNCGCRLCDAPGLPPRTQDCVAVSPGRAADGEDARGADGDGDGDPGWYLLNASPDIRAQILATPELAPPAGTRATPLRGAFLTDAELDHSMGLLMLREGEGMPVWAPRSVLAALCEAFPVRRITSHYGAGWRWTPIPLAHPFAVGGLRVTALPVGARRPRYATDVLEDVAAGVWTVAYRIEDPVTGGVLVYAPSLADWPDGFDAFVAGADLVLLDGTFHSAAELPGAAGQAHLPMTGPDGTLERVRRAGDADADAGGDGRTRWLYTHLNNTNPAIDPGSKQAAEVEVSGAAVPSDGAEFVL